MLVLLIDACCAPSAVYTIIRAQSRRSAQNIIIITSKQGLNYSREVIRD